MCTGPNGYLINSVIMLSVQVVGQWTRTIFYMRRLVLSVVLEKGEECDEITTSSSQWERSDR